MNGDVWKTLDWKNSELQGNYNSETDNIKIRHGKKDGIAYVFCSSNSLYKKDDRQDFVSKVVNKDKFEWENITQDIDHEKNYLYKRHMVELVCCRGKCKI